MDLTVSAGHVKLAPQAEGDTFGQGLQVMEIVVHKQIMVWQHCSRIPHTATHVLISRRYGHLTKGCFPMSFESIYHARTFHTWVKLPWINMVWNGIDPNNNSGIQWCSHLDILTRNEYWLVLKNLIPMGRFFDTILDVHYWYPCIYLCIGQTLITKESHNALRL